MSACSPLNQEEAKRIMQNFVGSQAIRNIALFVLGCATGMRITELLCLQIRDVLQPDGEFRKAIRFTGEIYKRRSETVKSENSKSTKKHTGEIRIKPFAYKYLAELLRELEKKGYQQPEDYLFITSTGKVLTRWAAYWIIRSAAEGAGIYRTIGTHSMRKTFAQDMYYQLEEAAKNNPNIKPMVSMKKVLRHSKYDSTLAYMAFLDTDLEQFYESSSFRL